MIKTCKKRETIMAADVSCLCNSRFVLKSPVLQSSDALYGIMGSGTVRIKAHSHQARLRPSTSVDARLRRYGTHAKKRSHQARLRPSTGVNALKIEPCSILSAFKAHSHQARLRPSTHVDVRRHASMCVDALDLATPSALHE